MHFPFTIEHHLHSLQLSFFNYPSWPLALGILLPYLTTITLHTTPPLQSTLLTLHYFSSLDFLHNPATCFVVHTRPDFPRVCWNFSFFSATSLRHLEPYTWCLVHSTWYLCFTRHYLSFTWNSLKIQNLFSCYHVFSSQSWWFWQLVIVDMIILIICHNRGHR